MRKATLRKNIIVIFICLIFAVLFSLVFLYPEKEKRLEKKVYNLQDLVMVGLENQNDDTIIAIDQDPQIIIDTKTDIYVSNIKIVLNESVKHQWRLQIYYADSISDFSEQNSAIVLVDEIESEVEVDINRTVSKLRVDLGDESGRVFSLSNIELNPGDGLFHIYNIPFSIVIVLLTVLFYTFYTIVMFLLYWGKKKSNNAMYIGIIFLYSLSVVAILLSSDSLQKSSFWESDLIETTLFDMSDIANEKAEYRIIGEKPYAIYKMKNDVYSRGILYFYEEAKEDLSVIIYYASRDGIYTDTNVVTCVQKKGTDYACFKLPNDQKISNLRVDYKGNIVGNKYNVLDIFVVKNNFITNIHGVFNSHTIIYLCMLSVLFILFFAIFYKNQKFWENYYANERVRTRVEIMLLIVLPIVLFWQYLIGQKCFIFTDIASDSIANIYPGYLFCADRIANKQWGEIFSFVIGLGDARDSLFPNINNWICFLGRDYVPYLMGINILIKMILSGLFAYGWISLFEIKDERRLIVAFGYEFNAMLTVRACWTAYPNLAFMVILWLFFFELAYRKKDTKSYLLLALTSLLFFQQFSIFYCVFYGACFGVYTFYRIYTENIKEKSKNIFILLSFIPFSILGVLDSFWDTFIAAISSSRISRGVDVVSSGTEQIYTIRWDELLEAFERTIGQTIGGIFYDFVGLHNFLEGPAFYCGIMVLLLVPITFYQLPKKKKCILATGYILAILYITVPFVRYIANGLAGGMFKTSSFWIVIMELLTLIEGFCSINKNGYRKGSLFIFNITSIIGILLLLVILIMNKVSRMEQWWISLVLIVSYFCCINLFYKYKIYVIRWIFTCCIICEGLLLSYGVINDRVAWTKEELDAIFYGNDYAAIKTIQNKDESWFRIEKQPVTVTLNDSWAQNYYGTTSYVGTAEIGKGVQDYYEAVGLPRAKGFHYLYGTNGNLYANSLMGVKYIILDNQKNIRFGIRKLATSNNIDIYINDLALPVAYCYSKVIDEKAFNKLSFLERNQVLLESCLVKEDLGLKEYELILNSDNVPEYKEYIFDDSTRMIELWNHHKDLIQLEIQFKQNGKIEDTNTLNFVPEDKEGEVTGYGSVCCKDVLGNESTMNYYYGGVLEFFGKDISSIEFDADTARLIDKIRVYEYDATEYYSDTVAAINKLQKNGMHIDYITDYEIAGTLKADADGIMATSIPIDANWEIYIDGEKQEVIEVNAGFIGSKITEGNHDVKIYYKHDSWFWDNKFKCLGMAIFIAMEFYFALKDIKNRRKKENEAN